MSTSAQLALQRAVLHGPERKPSHAAAEIATSRQREKEGAVALVVPEGMVVGVSSCCGYPLFWLV